MDAQPLMPAHRAGPEQRYHGVDERLLNIQGSQAARRQIIKQ
jgi:hypothetical protein